MSSRTKGASAERELAALIHERLGVKLKRNLEQSRSGGHDLTTDGETGTGIDRFTIECKRYRVTTPASIARWWNQTTQQADRAGKLPALAYRADRQSWRVVVPLAAINGAFGAWDGIEWTAELSLDGFCALAREAAP